MSKIVAQDDLETITTESVRKDKVVEFIKKEGFTVVRKGDIASCSRAQPKPLDPKEEPTESEIKKHNREMAKAHVFDINLCASTDFLRLTLAGFGVDIDALDGALE